MKRLSWTNIIIILWHTQVFIPTSLFWISVFIHKQEDYFSQRCRYILKLFLRRCFVIFKEKKNASIMYSTFSLQNTFLGREEIRLCTFVFGRRVLLQTCNFMLSSQDLNPLLYWLLSPRSLSALLVCIAF